MKDRVAHWLFRVRWRLGFWLLPLSQESGICGNRVWHRATHGNREYFFQVRQLDHGDAYSREELFRMLKTVREHERLMGWTCPEADDPAKTQLPSCFNVIVNGDTKLFIGQTAIAKDIADLAGMPWRPGLSITYQTRHGRLQAGILSGDKRILVEDDMVFNCYATGNA